MRRVNERVIIEAKAGLNGALSMTKKGQQLSQRWIAAKIDSLRKLKLHEYADELQQAIDDGRLSVMKVFTKVDSSGNVFDPEFILKSFNEVGKRVFSS